MNLKRFHKMEMHNWLLLLVVLNISTYSNGANLQYFSVWSLEDGPAVPEYSKWSNFIFTTSNVTQIEQAHAAGFTSNLFDAEYCFVDNTAAGATLRADYIKMWDKCRQEYIQPLLAKGAIKGIFFGDELVWRCLPYSNLTTMVNLARSTLPKELILYYNEAYPIFTGTTCFNKTTIHYPHVPTSFDWVSVDYYPDEGTLSGARKLYETLLYPKMTATQKALYVPPAYGAGSPSLSDQLCCSQHTRDGANPPCDGNCTKAMLEWAVGSYNWAKEDERIVGLNPWHFTGAPKKNARFEPGLLNMPAVYKKWQQIGEEIVSGRLGDVAAE